MRAFCFTSGLYSVVSSRRSNLPAHLERLADFVPPFPHLQFVVTAERHQEFKCFGTHLLEPAVDDDTLYPRRDYRLQVRRITDALVIAEQGHATAKAFGPVTGPEC